MLIIFLSFGCQIGHAKNKNIGKRLGNDKNITILIEI